MLDAQGSCDSCHIVSASRDKSIIYWDVTTGQPVRRLRQHAADVYCVKFNEESNVAVSGSRDNKVMCWDIRTRNLEPIQIMKDAKDCITGLIVTQYQIISSSLDRGIRQYDIRACKLITDLIASPINHIAATKDGQCVVAACEDDTIRLIDFESGDELQKFKGHKTEGFRIECGVIANDTRVLSGSTDGLVIFWDLLEGNEVGQLKVGHKYITSLAVHPAKDEILFAHRQEVQLWSPPSSSSSPTS